MYGLPQLIRYSEEGFKTIGFDIDQEKVNQLNLGKSYIKHIPDAKINSPIYAIPLFSFYLPRNDITNLIATLYNFIIFSTFYFLIYQFIPKQKKIVKIK